MDRPKLISLHALLPPTSPTSPSRALPPRTQDRRRRRRPSFRVGFRELKSPTKFAEMRSKSRVSTSRCFPGLKYQQMPGTSQDKAKPSFIGAPSLVHLVPHPPSLLHVWNPCSSVAPFHTCFFPLHFMLLSAHQNLSILGTPVSSRGNPRRLAASWRPRCRTKRCLGSQPWNIDS